MIRKTTLEAPSLWEQFNEFVPLKVWNFSADVICGKKETLVSKMAKIKEDYCLFPTIRIVYKFCRSQSIPKTNQISETGRLCLSALLSSVS